MIAFLQGKLIGKTDAYGVVLTGGVGYKVFAPGSVLEKEIDSDLEVYIYTQVREDAMNLYGFLTRAELATFELLISVSGVGPKMALSILSAGDPNHIQNAIVNQDVAVFTAISGVGRKTAERIIVELKEKMGAMVHSEPGSVTSSAGELMIALESLGYSQREIREVLSHIERSAPVEEQLRQALKVLSKK
jgi:holliday junction DNA helicase RuvA